MGRLEYVSIEIAVTLIAFVLRIAVRIRQPFELWGCWIGIRVASFYLSLHI